jgi:hypothetical protein
MCFANTREALSSNWCLPNKKCSLFWSVCFVHMFASRYVVCQYQCLMLQMLPILCTRIHVSRISRHISFPLTATCNNMFNKMFAPYVLRFLIQCCIVDCIKSVPPRSNNYLWLKLIIHNKKFCTSTCCAHEANPIKLPVTVIPDSIKVQNFHNMHKLN